MTSGTTSHFSSQEETIWLAVRISESILIVIINTFTLIAFARNRCLRKRSTYLIINQTLADLLVGAVAEPLGICSPDRYTRGPSWKEFSYKTAYGLFPISSLINLSLISLERLHATLYPFAHCLITERFYFKTIICNWLLALLVASINAAYISKIGGSYYLWASFMLLILLILTASYFIIIVKIKRSPPPHSGGVVASDRKLSVTLFIVTAVSVMTILPYAVYIAIRLEDDMWRELSSAKQFYVLLSAHVLYYACSFVNPLIYAMRMQEFRKTVHKQLNCRKTTDLSLVQPTELRAM